MSTLTDAPTLTSREQFIHGLRQLADLLEGRDDLPAPAGEKLTAYILGEDRIDRIFDLAESLSVPVTRYEIDGHYVYNAAIQFAGGPLYQLYVRGEDVPRRAPADRVVVQRPQRTDGAA